MPRGTIQLCSISSAAQTANGDLTAAVDTLRRRAGCSARDVCCAPAGCAPDRMGGLGSAHRMSAAHARLRRSVVAPASAPYGKVCVDAEVGDRAQLGRKFVGFAPRLAALAPNTTSTMARIFCAPHHGRAGRGACWRSSALHLSARSIFRPSVCRLLLALHRPLAAQTGLPGESSAPTGDASERSGASEGGRRF